MPQALKPLCLTQIGGIPFSYFQASSLWGNKIWAPQYKDVEVGKLREQNWLCPGCEWVQFECPRVTNFCVSLTFDVNIWITLLFCQKIALAPRDCFDRGIAARITDKCVASEEGHHICRRRETRREKEEG